MQKSNSVSLRRMSPLPWDDLPTADNKGAPVSRGSFVSVASWDFFSPPGSSEEATSSAHGKRCQTMRFQERMTAPSAPDVTNSR